MIKNRMAQRGQAGFTLIELLVVVAILAILTGIAVVGIGKMRENANKSACASDKDTIETAAMAAEVSGDGTGTAAQLVTSNYLKRVADANGWSINWTSGAPVASYTAGQSAYGGQGC